MSILIVIVRYKTPLTESSTIATLSQAFLAYPELLEACRVLVWDNSPVPAANKELPFPYEYQHTKENLGVSGAYNRAMATAEAEGCPWMLLLDQDTTLPGHFLHRMLEMSRAEEKNEEIAAIVPFLFDGEQPISPIKMLFYGNSPIQPPFSGPYPRPMFAANSGTLMRVEALREVGGYEENFWLDLSDVVVFHRLYKCGRRVFIAGDLHVQHKVTNNDYDGSMSPERYINFSSAEGAYWDLYRSRFQNMIQTARLFARTLRQYRRYRNKAFSKITWSYFCQRLFLSKAARLQRWHEQSLQRSLPAISEGRIVG